MTALDPADRTELEAAAFRTLLQHLRQRPDVQNIDLMTLAGFCRNCLANWLDEAAQARNVPMTRDAAREYVYGMPYAEWKRLNQTDVSATRQTEFEQGMPHRHG